MLSYSWFAVFSLSVKRSRPDQRYGLGQHAYVNNVWIIMLQFVRSSRSSGVVSTGRHTAAVAVSGARDGDAPPPRDRNAGRSYLAQSFRYCNWWCFNHLFISTTYRTLFFHALDNWFYVSFFDMEFFHKGYWFNHYVSHCFNKRVLVGYFA